jgi:hypothetical protein
MAVAAVWPRRLAARRRCIWMTDDAAAIGIVTSCRSGVDGRRALGACALAGMRVLKLETRR